MSHHPRPPAASGRVWYARNPRRSPGTSAAAYEFVEAVWWTAAEAVSIDRSGSHVRSDSSAPHSARRMMAGWLGAAVATSAAVVTRAPFVDADAWSTFDTGSSPGSMSTAFSPVTRPGSASAQTWRPSASTATMGSVAPRVEPAPSGEDASGATSDGATASHSLQTPACRTR